MYVKTCSAVLQLADEVALLISSQFRPLAKEKRGTISIETSQLLYVIAVLVLPVLGQTRNHEEMLDHLTRWMKDLGHMDGTGLSTRLEV